MTIVRIETIEKASENRSDSDYSGHNSYSSYLDFTVEYRTN